MTNWARSEREALCDRLLEAGPDAPTLCGTWTTRDLAAHLVLRERRPDAAVGILVRAASGHTASVQRSLAAGDWPALVERVRTGPPWWSPTAWSVLDAMANTVEFFVHHEDIRRAGEEWEPRRLDPDEDAVLWQSLRRSSRFMLRHAGVGVAAHSTTGEEATLRKGEPRVVVSGAPGELVLFASGRQGYARVGLVGPDDAVATLTRARLGL